MPCLILSLIGIGLASYLFYLHLGLLRGELLGGVVCSGTGAFNCHAVTGGAWSSLLGMPLALWGLLGYVAVCALTLLARHTSEWASRAMALIFGVAVIFVIVDLALLSVMAFIIRYYCLFCLLTYAVNLSLLVVAARALGIPWLRAIGRIPSALGALLPSGSRPEMLLFWGMLLAGFGGVVGVHAATTFVSRGPMGSVRQQLRDYLAKQIRVNVTLANDPTIGRADAPIRIIEFSDLFCPACQRASKLNTIILANHRQDAAFSFKHYPLDTTCNDRINRIVHPGACRAAAAAECAHFQGKFWALHDRIFEKAPPYDLGRLDEDARRIGLDMPRFHACVESGEGLQAVKQDIAEGAKVGVTSTPTYIVNGVPIAGGMSPPSFEDFIAVLRETDGGMARR